MTYTAWDIVAVPFPFTEGKGDKRRPAVIISTSSLSEQHDLYWLLMITSAQNAGWPDDVHIDHLDQSGLASPSVIRPAKIATLQTDKIIRKVGTLHKSEQDKVKKIIKKFLLS